MDTAGMLAVVARPSNVLRPDRRRIFWGAVAGVAGVVVPSYLTAFLLRLPGRVDLALLLPIVLLPLIAALAWLRVRRAAVELRGDGLHETRILPPDRFTRRIDVASMVVLRIVDGRELRPPRQLFVLDSAGETLLRLRESTWGAGQLDALRERLQVPAQTIADPLTVGELRRQGVVRLPFLERHPTLRGLAATAALILAGLLLLLPIFPR